MITGLLCEVEGIWFEIPVQVDLGQEVEVVAYFAGSVVGFNMRLDASVRKPNGEVLEFIGQPYVYGGYTMYDSFSWVCDIEGTYSMTVILYTWETGQAPQEVDRVEVIAAYAGTPSPIPPPPPEPPSPPPPEDPPLTGAITGILYYGTDGVWYPKPLQVKVGSGSGIMGYFYDPSSVGREMRLDLELLRPDGGIANYQGIPQIVGEYVRTQDFYFTCDVEGEYKPTLTLYVAEVGDLVPVDTWVGDPIQVTAKTNLALAAGLGAAVITLGAIVVSQKGARW